ncbi:conjugative transfer domain protein [Orientia chuto str. Dubai]|uniref:Conjugative transfer domain protein n=1 Tax=Orientia chuto str. Dubai TaxID=1359168 RepID=A0A0F3MRM2_9RICK|nr:hypothetical protein [Candidatus Orientia mediorientalis]KJV57249.1 conjugative transfer domain protein [Orientia chuto str. Dubai]
MRILRLLLILEVKDLKQFIYKVIIQNKLVICLAGATILVTLILLLICVSLISFFRSDDFDCKIPKGVKCKSLSEIKEMVAQGFFDSDNIESRKSK